MINFGNMIDYNFLSEEEQIQAIKNNSKTISYIKNPSEKVQLEAIKTRPASIAWIKDPLEFMQIESVKNIIDHDHDYYFYYNQYDRDHFIKRHITSEKAKELYFKLKKTKEIIK